MHPNVTLYQQRTGIAAPFVHGENGSIDDSDVAPVGVHTGCRVVAREDAIDEVGACRQRAAGSTIRVQNKCDSLISLRRHSDTRYACQLTPTEGLVAIDTGSKINATGGVLKVHKHEQLAARSQNLNMCKNSSVMLHPASYSVPETSRNTRRQLGRSRMQS